MGSAHPCHNYIKHKTHICHLHFDHNAPFLTFNLFLLDIVVAPGEIEDNANAKGFLFFSFLFFFGRGQTRSIWEMYKWEIPKYYFTLLAITKGIYHATAFFRGGFRWWGIAGVYIICQLIKNLAQELMGILNK